MGPLVFMLVTLALLLGFYGLTVYETGRGIRLFAPVRERLDHNVERAEFIYFNVDLYAFFREEMTHLSMRVWHDTVHAILRAVRTIERFLTRHFRFLRARQQKIFDKVPRENVREFVKTLTDFKGQLEVVSPVLSEGDLPDTVQ
jgi:hypothetical protein